MEKQLAEVKLFKVGEPLTCDDDGNPELSPRHGESVETGRKVCIRCGELITKTRAYKYCSDRCRSADGAYRYCLRHNKFENPGVGSGGNQYGENNNQWTGRSGVAGCRRAMKKLPNICNRCGSTNMLVAHHIDEDRTNNDLSNFEILCKICHQRHHTADRRDPSTGKYIKGQSTPQ